MLVMESLLNEPSLSPRKQIKNSRRKTHHPHHHHQPQHHTARLPNISRQSSCGAVPRKYAPPPHVQLEMVHTMAGGVFLNHFPNQFSLSSTLPPILPTYHQQKINNQHQQPPLLPLPVVSKPTFRSLPPSLTRGHSISSSVLPKKQPNNTKPNSATTNTKKTAPPNPNKELVGKSKPSTTTTTTGKKNGSSMFENNDQQSSGSAKGVKPDPGSTPKEVTRVLQAANHKNEVVDEKRKFLTAASVFSLSPESPPPSSLPLPKFQLRKVQQNKLSCNAEAAAAEVDTGATDNLRRLLKLR